MSKLYRFTVNELAVFVPYSRKLSPPARVKGKPVGEKYAPEDRQVAVCLGNGHSDI